MHRPASGRLFIGGLERPLDLPLGRWHPQLDVEAAFSLSSIDGRFAVHDWLPVVEGRHEWTTNGLIQGGYSAVSTKGLRLDYWLNYSNPLPRLDSVLAYRLSARSHAGDWDQSTDPAR